MGLLGCALLILCCYFSVFLVWNRERKQKLKVNESQEILNNISLRDEKCKDIETVLKNLDTLCKKNNIVLNTNLKGYLKDIRWI